MATNIICKKNAFKKLFIYRKNFSKINTDNTQINYFIHDQNDKYTR